MDDLFIVIDNQTGKEISDAEVTRIAKEGGLIERWSYRSRYRLFCHYTGRESYTS